MKQHLSLKIAQRTALAAAAILLLASCSESDPDAGTLHPVRISTSIAATSALTTRMTLADNGSGHFDTGDVMSIFTTTASPTKALQLHTYTVGQSTLYWEDLGYMQQISFKAVYPRLPDGQDKTGLFTFDAAQAARQDPKQADLLLGEAINIKPGNEVAIKFDHVLHRIRVLLQSDVFSQTELDAARIRVNSLLTACSVDVLSGAIEKLPSTSTSVPYPELVGADVSFYLPRQEVTPEQQKNLLSISIGGHTYLMSPPSVLYDLSGQGYNFSPLQKGYQTTLTLKVNFDGVELVSGTVGAWDTTGKVDDMMDLSEAVEVIDNVMELIEALELSRSTYDKPYTLTNDITLYYYIIVEALSHPNIRVRDYKILDGAGHTITREEPKDPSSDFGEFITNEGSLILKDIKLADNYDHEWLTTSNSGKLILDEGMELINAIGYRQSPFIAVHDGGTLTLDGPIFRAGTTTTQWVSAENQSTIYLKDFTFESEQDYIGINPSSRLYLKPGLKKHLKLQLHAVENNFAIMATDGKFTEDDAGYIQFAPGSTVIMADGEALSPDDFLLRPNKDCNSLILALKVNSANDLKSAMQNMIGTDSKVGYIMLTSDFKVDKGTLDLMKDQQGQGRHITLDGCGHKLTYTGEKGLGTIGEGCVLGLKNITIETDSDPDYLFLSSGGYATYLEGFVVVSPSTR